METNRPCIRCGKIPADGWYSKSGYCKECAEAILKENEKKKIVHYTKRRAELQYYVFLWLLSLLIQLGLQAAAQV